MTLTTLLWLVPTSYMLRPQTVIIVRKTIINRATSLTTKTAMKPISLPLARSVLPSYRTSHTVIPTLTGAVTTIKGNTDIG